VPQEEGPNQDSEAGLGWESDTASNDAQTLARPAFG
jgi:hypothetical protein